MGDKNRNRDNSYNQSYNNWNQNRDRFNEQYRGRDPRYNEDVSRKVNYPGNDENRSYNEHDYEDKNYGSSGSYGYRGDPEKDDNRQMDRQSGNRKMKTNYGNNYQGWGGYNEDYRSGHNRFSNRGSSSGNRDFYGSYNEASNPGDPYAGKDRDYSMNRDYNQQANDRDRDLWDRSRDEVASWFGDRDAERRREMDKTTGEHRGKGPRGYQRSEQRIREDVCDRLTDDDRVDASGIEVKVEGTEVVLSGTVNSREEKRRAEDLVELIPGVQNVENRIHVNRSDNLGSERMRDIDTGTSYESNRSRKENRNEKK